MSGKHERDNNLAMPKLVMSIEEVKEKVAEDPLKYMNSLEKRLHPDNITSLNFRALRDYLEIATVIIDKHAAKLGEKRESYARLVEDAKQHLKSRIGKRKKMASDIAVRLGDYGRPLSQGEITDIEASIGKMRDYLGLPDTEEQEIRKRLEARKEHERISQRVDSLSIYFTTGMSEEKLKLLHSMFDTLRKRHPTHPKVMALGEKLDIAERSLSEQKMRKELESFLPEAAKPHLTALVSKLNEVEAGEGGLVKASTDFLVAVNKESLRGMGKSIAPGDFEKSRRALEYVELVHKIVGADRSHLQRFESLLEEAEKYVPKK